MPRLILSLSGTEQEITQLTHNNLYVMQVEKRGIKNLNTKKQGWGGWDDPTFAIPRKQREL